MSTETKIGLIVGLGFIVCFAVLLANSSPEQKSAIQWTHVVDGVTTNRFDSQPRVAAVPAKPDSNGRAGGDSAVQHTDVSPLRGRKAPRLDRTSILPLSQSIPARMGDPQQGNPSSLPLAPESVDEDVLSPRTLDSTAATSLVDNQGNEQLREYLDARKSPQAEARAADETTNRVVAHGEAARSLHGNAPRRLSTRSEVPSERAVANLRRHLVEAGDTLTRIAVKYYGSRSRRVTDAIFDANRATLPDADHLSVGMKLMLPPLVGLGSSTSIPIRSESTTVADRSSKSQARPGGKSASPTWYQIQKNDRYVSIARAQLGDGSRWREIHELNKDRFPDPGRIQWGVRIRLPAVVLSATGNP